MKPETVASVIRRFAVVLKDSRDAILVHDLQGNIMAWNEGAEEMYGYNEAEALELNIAQIVPADKIIKYMEIVERIASGEIVEPFETQRVSKAGKILDILLVMTCLKDDAGVIVSIATTERDITEIKDKQKAELKKLAGILPICAHCKQIRDDAGYWHEIESYLRNHAEVEFSHGICPKCAGKLYPDIYPKKNKK